jgi:hypothetical protein
MATPEQVVEYLESHESHSWSKCDRTREMIREASAMLTVPHHEVSAGYSQKTKEEVLEALLTHKWLAGLYDGRDQG